MEDINWAENDKQIKEQTKINKAHNRERARNGYMRPSEAKNQRKSFDRADNEGNIIKAPQDRANNPDRKPGMGGY